MAATRLLFPYLPLPVSLGAVLVAWNRRSSGGHDGGHLPEWVAPFLRDEVEGTMLSRNTSLVPHYHPLEQPLLLQRYVLSGAGVRCRGTNGALDLD
jgi:hypothetical protein